MSLDQRLGQIVSALERSGLDVLVMGGHAVRYYGVGRNTVDFDFYTSAKSIPDVRERLSHAGLFPVMREGPSWRPNDFARFEIGRLPDGREEWLEFWLHNHLLPEFTVLRSRQERGVYGGRPVSFISLPDLLRSKETEREGDWQDIALLEEIQDARNLTTGDAPLVLSHLRSRRGFKQAIESGLLVNESVPRAAAEQCQHPISFAFLLPRLPDVAPPSSLRMAIGEPHLAFLRAVELGSTRHLALVEVVRRAYKRWAMEIDRRDKQSHLQQV